MKTSDHRVLAILLTFVINNHLIYIEIFDVIWRQNFTS